MNFIKLSQHKFTWNINHKKNLIYTTPNKTIQILHKTPKPDRPPKFHRTEKRKKQVPHHRMQSASKARPAGSHSLFGRRKANSSLFAYICERAFRLFALRSTARGGLLFKHGPAFVRVTINGSLWRWFFSSPSPVSVSCWMRVSSFVEGWNPIEMFRWVGGGVAFEACKKTGVFPIRNPSESYFGKLKWAKCIFFIN